MWINVGSRITDFSIFLCRWTFYIKNKLNKLVQGTVFFEIFLLFIAIYLAYTSTVY